MYPPKKKLICLKVGSLKASTEPFPCSKPALDPGTSYNPERLPGTACLPISPLTSSPSCQLASRHTGFYQAQNMQVRQPLGPWPLPRRLSLWLLPKNLSGLCLNPTFPDHSQIACIPPCLPPVTVPAEPPTALITLRNLFHYSYVCWLSSLLSQQVPFFEDRNCVFLALQWVLPCV